MAEKKYIGISEDAYAAGNDFPTFCAYVRGLVEATRFEQINPQLINIYSFDENTADPKLWERPGKPNAIRYIVSSHSSKRGHMNLPNSLATQSEMLTAFAKEKTLIKYGKDSYYVLSGTAAHHLCSKMSVGVNSPIIERNNLIMAVLDDAEEDLYWVARVDMNAPAEVRENCKKLFSVHGRMYAFVPQTVLIALTEKLREAMGQEKVVGWSVNHYETSIMMAYPEKAEELAALLSKMPDRFIPSARLITSDVGERSLTIEAMYHIEYEDVNGNWISLNVPFDSYSRSHKGESNTVSNDFLKNAEDIWTIWTSIPERLANLLTVNIRYDDVPEILAKALESCAFQKRQVIGKMQIASLVGLLSTELGVLWKKDEGRKTEFVVLNEGYCNAYEIAIALLSCPQRLEGAEKTSIKTLEQRIGRSVHFPFEKYAVNGDGKYLNRKEEKLMLKPKSSSDQATVA